MSQRQVVVVFNPDGTTKIEALGFKGQGCTEATAVIEQALTGGGAVDRHMKPEANEIELETNFGQQQTY